MLKESTLTFDGVLRGSVGPHKILKVSVVFKKALANSAGLQCAQGESAASQSFAEGGAGPQCAQIGGAAWRRLAPPSTGLQCAQGGDADLQDLLEISAAP